jgi:hypothetical protein
MDLAVDDIGLNRGTRPVFKFFRCPNDFITQKVYFLQLMRVCALCLVQVSMLLIGQQGLGHFFRYRPLLPIDWRIVQILHQLRAGGKRPIQRQPLLVQYKQQANPLLSINNYTPVVISGNDKNKQLTLLKRYCNEKFKG